jgi:hypothetical protein
MKVSAEPDRSKSVTFPVDSDHDPARPISKRATSIGSWRSRTTYEDRRASGKIGPKIGIILLFKSVVGLGLFTSPYGYGKVGLVLGAILTTLVCYLITYGIVTLLNSKSFQKSNL